MIWSRHEIRFTAVADRDFFEIMDWSAVHFGAAAADRYEALIRQALIDLAENPFRPGSQRRSELPSGVYTYHLVSSRDRMLGEGVKSPRHFVLYRVDSPFVEVLRLLHDSRDLARHLETKL